MRVMRMATMVVGTSRGARRVDEWSLIEKKIPSFDLVFDFDRKKAVASDVELTRDGGSFSTRRVVARQRAKTIFHMAAGCSASPWSAHHRCTSSRTFWIAYDSAAGSPG